MNAAHPAEGLWLRRLLWTWLVLAIVAGLLYFLGVLSGYFGSYNTPLTIVPTSQKLGQSILPIFAISFVLSALTTMLWKRPAGSTSLHTAMHFAGIWVAYFGIIFLIYSVGISQQLQIGADFITISPSASAATSSGSTTTNTAPSASASASTGSTSGRTSFVSPSASATTSSSSTATTTAPSASTRTSNTSSPKSTATVSPNASPSSQPNSSGSTTVTASPSASGAASAVQSGAVGSSSSGSTTTTDGQVATTSTTTGNQVSPTGTMTNRQVATTAGSNLGAAVASTVSSVIATEPHAAPRTVTAALVETGPAVLPLTGLSLLASLLFVLIWWKIDESHVAGAI